MYCINFSKKSAENLDFSMIFKIVLEKHGPILGSKKFILRPLCGVTRGPFSTQFDALQNVLFKRASLLGPSVSRNYSFHATQLIVIVLSSYLNDWKRSTVLSIIDYIDVNASVFYQLHRCLCISVFINYIDVFKFLV